MSTLEREGLEEAYETGIAKAVAALVETLSIGERLGKTPPEMLGRFMGAFSAAAEEQGRDAAA